MHQINYITSLGCSLAASVVCPVRSVLYSSLRQYCYRLMCFNGVLYNIIIMAWHVDVVYNVKRCVYNDVLYTQVRLLGVCV